MSILHFILLLLDQEHDDGQDREIRNAKNQYPLSPPSTPEWIINTFYLEG